MDVTVSLEDRVGGGEIERTVHGENKPLLDLGRGGSRFQTTGLGIS